MKSFPRRAGTAATTQKKEPMKNVTDNKAKVKMADVGHLMINLRDEEALWALKTFLADLDSGQTKVFLRVRCSS